LKKDPVPVEKKKVSEPVAPRPRTPIGPLAVAIVFVIAAFAAMYYAGFFTPRPVKKEFVCWNSLVVDSPDKCPPQPVLQCPSPVPCPSVAASTPVVITERPAGAGGKQAVAATVFRVADFNASNDMLYLVLENAVDDEKYSNVNVVGISTTNDSEKTGDWVGSIRLIVPGEKSAPVAISEKSIAAKNFGENFSVTVTIYYTNWRAEQRQEQWILKGRVE